MSAEVFPHFVGCGRSGTTLFRNIFDAHSRLAVTHEAHFIGPMAKQRARYETTGGFDEEAFVTDLFRDSNFRRQGLDEDSVRKVLDSSRPRTYADAVRAVFSLYAREQGKELYGDKTPGSVSHIELIATLFPESKFVHIIRDGRAVALSYLERPEWGPRTMAEAANHWKSRVSRGREAGRDLGPDRYIEARYEELVEDPESVTRKLCAFLGLEFEEPMLDFHKRGREFISETKDPEAFKNLAKPVGGELRDWAEEISESDLSLFDAIAGDHLRDLGYEVLAPSPSISTRVRVAGAAIAWQGKRLMSVLPSRGKESSDVAEPGREAG